MQENAKSASCFSPRIRIIPFVCSTHFVLFFFCHLSQGRCLAERCDPCLHRFGYLFESRLGAQSIKTRIEREGAKIDPAFGHGRAQMIERGFSGVEGRFDGRDAIEDFRVVRRNGQRIELTFQGKIQNFAAGFFLALGQAQPAERGLIADRSEKIPAARQDLFGKIRVDLRCSC